MASGHKDPLMVPSDSGRCAPAPQTANKAKVHERIPLLSKMRETFVEAYSLKPHCSTENGVVLDYEPYKLTSLRGLLAFEGTVLVDPVLLVEQVIYSIIFFGVGGTLYYLQSKTLGAAKEDRRYIFDKLTEQEDLMRKFSLIITMLAAFLLSLYTGVMVGRWWTIRTQGVGAIKTAASELVMYISQFVTKDAEVLSAIQRNARASLRMIFLWRRRLMTHEQADEQAVREELVESGILTDEEVDLLFSPGWHKNLWESIWTWNVCIVQTLHEEGLIKSEQLLVMLLDKCSIGRNGIQVIATHLETKVPLSYVHLLGLIVKLHNLVCAVIMGVLLSVAIKERNGIIMCQLFGRTLLMPFIFNAILLINAELSDPFDGGVGDFPQEAYDKGIDTGCQSIVMAGAQLPQWLAERRERKAEVQK